MTFTSRSRSQATSSENLVIAITQKGSHVGLQIYTKRVSIKDLGRVRILVTLTSKSRSQAISSENLVIVITQEGSHVGFSNLYQACIYKRSQTSSDSGDLDLKVKVTGHFWWKSCDCDNSIGFSNLYQRCIYKWSRTSLDSGDLDLKVRVTGDFLWKSCDRVNSITKSRRLLKFIPKMYL